MDDRVESPQGVRHKEGCMPSISSECSCGVWDRLFHPLKPEGCTCQFPYHLNTLNNCGHRTGCPAFDKPTPELPPLMLPESKTSKIVRYRRGGYSDMGFERVEQDGYAELVSYVDSGIVARYLGYKRYASYSPIGVIEYDRIIEILDHVDEDTLKTVRQ